MKITSFIVSVVFFAGCSMLDIRAEAASASGSGSSIRVQPAATAVSNWTHNVVQTADGGFLMGNPRAPVKVIEYGSRTCPHCARFSKEGEPLLKTKYVATGKVSYEYRDFLIHAPDLAAVLLGQCNGPAPFFPILEDMMADQDRVLGLWSALPSSLSEQLTGKSPNEQSAIWAEQLGYIKFVAQRGIPRTKARACLANTKAVDKLGGLMTAAIKTFNVDRTPFFIINGVPANGVTDWLTLEAAIKAAGA